MNWFDEVENDVYHALHYFDNEILEQLVEDEEASIYLSDYSEAYHHEQHVDQHYSLIQAAGVLDQLAEWEETDSGLWEGVDMRRAVSVCAAYTYGNAVYSKFQDRVEEINQIFTELVEDLDEDDYAVYVEGRYFVEYPNGPPPIVFYATEEEAEAVIASIEKIDHGCCVGENDPDPYLTEAALVERKKQLAQSAFNQVIKQLEN